MTYIIYLVVFLVGYICGVLRTNYKWKKLVNTRINWAQIEKEFSDSENKNA